MNEVRVSTIKMAETLCICHATNHLQPTSTEFSSFFSDIDIAILSVCLSVRDVPVSDENGSTYRHSFFFTVR